MGTNNKEYKFLKFVEFKDLENWDISTLKHILSNIEESQKPLYEKLFWKSIVESSDDELRNSLLFLVELTSWYWNQKFQELASVNSNSPHRNIKYIPNMRRNTILTHLNYILSVDLREVIISAKEKIEEEKKKLYNSECIYNNINL